MSWTFAILSRGRPCGIDISKDTAPADRLDWAVYTQQHGILLSTHTDNTLKGIKASLAQLRVLPGWNSTQAVFCMEHTGIYNAHLLELLHESKLSIWLESSLQIKQAGGMQGGKTDKVDAQRIAQYAYGTGHPALPRSNAPLAATRRGNPEIGLSNGAARAVRLANDSIRHITCWPFR